MAVDHGIEGQLQTTIPIAMTMVAFIAISLYNMLELLFLIATTFKKRSGLYFWSFLVSTIGFLPYDLGFIFKFFGVINNEFLNIALVASGWYCIVTGQSVVLYSRLHLVVRNQTKLNVVLIMIIANVFISHIPTTVLAFGSVSSNPGAFPKLYSIYEKIQITLFFVQETIISGLYVFETFRLLRTAGQVRNTNTRKIMRHLIYINVIIILLDITLLGTEYSGHYEIQTTYKAALYSVKLKMEFSILNQLVSITQAGRPTTGISADIHTHRSVHLGTLTSSGKRSTKNRHSSAVGYSAYAKQGDEIDIDQDTKGVVRTTEVIIERTDIVDGSSERDLEDAAIKTAQARSKIRRLSPSSSEVQFAEHGA